ncbi:uncharacterized protein LOC135961263 [Calliphora vicina]|uniref:uncharacterized protein LOC135961263 n=1 Tax=Calliphora vicina TaxID=7373 RepID=UPI00325AF7FE
MMQINLHHCEAASTELTNFLTKSQTDVALIQEPWINQNKVCGLGIAGYTFGDITVVNRETRAERTLTFSSVYMPYEVADPPGNEVLELTVYAERRGVILVIGCDANDHHSQWGSADINKRDLHL